MSRDVASIADRLKTLENALKTKGVESSSNYRDRGFTTPTKGNVPSSGGRGGSVEAQMAFKKSQADRAIALTEINAIVEGIVFTNNIMVSRVFDLFKSYTDITLYERLNDVEDNSGVKFKEMTGVAAEHEPALEVSRDSDESLFYDAVSFRGGDDSCDTDSLHDKLVALESKKVFIGSLLKSNYDLLTANGLNQIMRESDLSESFNANNENLLKGICAYNKILLDLIEVKNKQYNVGAEIDSSSVVEAKTNNMKLIFELRKQEEIEATKKVLAEAKILLNDSATAVHERGGMLSSLRGLMVPIKTIIERNAEYANKLIGFAGIDLVIQMSLEYQREDAVLFSKIKSFLQSTNVGGLDARKEVLAVEEGGVGDINHANSIAASARIIDDKLCSASSDLDRAIARMKERVATHKATTNHSSADGRPPVTPTLSPTRKLVYENLDVLAEENADLKRQLDELKMAKERERAGFLTDRERMEAKITDLSKQISKISASNSHLKNRLANILVSHDGAAPSQALREAVSSKLVRSSKFGNQTK